MVFSILSTKLFIPTVSHEVIHRPRLFEKLTEGLKNGHSLTLISAPAGYGKTTLLTEWISTYQGQVGWLSLDEQDNNESRFWKYFVSTFQTISNELVQKSLQNLEANQGKDSSFFLTELVNDLTSVDQRKILVLDDFHVISNLAILEGLKFLLDHLPPTLHLIIVTRVDPRLSVSRLRAQGKLTEIRIADLRFTSGETLEFFNNLMNLELNSSDIQALETRTEGWIAGLKLAALSIQGNENAHSFIQSFTGNQQYILEYLVEEVLLRQPEAIQRFLVETSILERMCAPLCNAVTDTTDSDNILTELNHRNLFVIPLDAEHYWYRYHHLFAEFLKSYLKRKQADDLPTLHRRAAEWYKSNNHLEEALRHGFAIPDYQFVSQLVLNNWRRIYHQGHLNTAVQWLETLPIDFIRKTPPLGVAVCWTLFTRGDYDRIQLYLDDITREFEQMVESGTVPKEHPEFSIINQQVVLLKAIVMRHRGDIPTAMNLIEELIPTIDELRVNLGQTIADMGYTACYSQMGYNYVSAKDYNQADYYLSKVSPHARQCQNFLALAHSTMEWVRVNLILGKIDQAERICRNELALMQQSEFADYPAFGLIQLALADVLRAKNLLQEAATFLETGLETARKSGHVYYLGRGYLIAARLHHELGMENLVQEDLKNAEQIGLSIQNNLLDEMIIQTKKSLESKPSPKQDLIEPLSDRELDVLNLICAGRSNQEIADELFIALDTVKRHVNNIYGKLGVRRRSQAIIESRKLGLF